MTPADIISERLYRQQLSQSVFTTPYEVVSWMGAMQAQDFQAAKWAVGCRLPFSTEKDLETAISDASIVRSWPMRGTLHFVAAEDLPWMLQLLTPHILSAQKGRHRQLELDDKVFSRTGRLLERALGKYNALPRPQLLSMLNENGIATTGQRGAHILQYHALKGLICLAPHHGKQPAFALLEAWIKRKKSLGREERLGELTYRYFRSHGPATIDDFKWWSGLRIAEIREGLALCKGKLEPFSFGENEYWTESVPLGTLPPVPPVSLLPGFDEYMLGYRDRSLSLKPADAPSVVPGNNGMFLPIFLRKGYIRGIWRHKIHKQTLEVSLSPFREKDAPGPRQLAVEIKKYKAFLGLQ